MGRGLMLMLLILQSAVGILPRKMGTILSSKCSIAIDEMSRNSCNSSCVRGATLTSLNARNTRIISSSTCNMRNSIAARYTHVCDPRQHIGKLSTRTQIETSIKYKDRCHQRYSPHNNSFTQWLISTEYRDVTKLNLNIRLIPFHIAI